MPRIWIEQKPTINPGDKFMEELFAQLGPSYSVRAGAVTLKARFVFFWPTPLGRLPVMEPSVNALVRGVLDKLNGHTWTDEKLLVAVHAAKEYGNVSGVQLIW